MSGKQLIRTLVIDDSAFSRQAITRMLQTSPLVEVVGAARDGEEALRKTFEQKLRTGGHLLLGHSESLINITSGLELRHLRSDLVYRKPVLGLRRPDPWHVAAMRAIGDAERSDER